MVRQGHLGLKVGYMLLLNTMKCIVNLVYFIYYNLHSHSFHSAGDRGLPGFQGPKGLLKRHCFL